MAITSFWIRTATRSCASWGTLNAINLNTGEYAWKIPFGEIPNLRRKVSSERAQRTTVDP